MDIVKHDVVPLLPSGTKGNTKRVQRPYLFTIFTVLCGILLLLGGSLKYYLNKEGLTISPFWVKDGKKATVGAALKKPTGRVPSHVNYDLVVSQAWRNPDGGFWRPMFVGNSDSPVPIINAHEGDMIHISIHNDLGLPSTLHWLGFRHYFGQTWNDGAAGVTTYPILPRGNWTSTLNATDQWGLKWYAEHCTTPLFDGFYGTIWIAPSPERERPYHLVSQDEVDIQDMLDAEETPEHVTIYNYQHRTYDGLLTQLQAEGYDPYCFQSVLINGQGRVHCKPDDLEHLKGKKVNSYGCIDQATGAKAYGECEPSEADYYVTETNNRRWMMINFINSGLENPWRVSIDEHEMWVVANDAGFIHPRKVDILTLRNGQRLTVMVKLDKKPADYAIRYHAVSDRQSLQGYSVLRYPHRRTGKQIWQPVPRPDQSLSAMEYDATPKKGFTLLDEQDEPPYPPNPPPKKSDITLHMRARGAPDPYNPYVMNYTLNGAPWQPWRALRDPLVLSPAADIAGPNPIVRDLPLGSYVDIIVQNELGDELSMYKHNEPTWLLGFGEGEFEWDDVAHAHRERPDLINLEDPPMGFFQRLPPHGWLAIRWHIWQPAMTMFHVFNAKQFVMGMQVPMFEGDDHWPEIPEEVKNRPHVEFKVPDRMGIFD